MKLQQNKECHGQVKSLQVKPSKKAQRTGQESQSWALDPCSILQGVWRGFRGVAFDTWKNCLHPISALPSPLLYSPSSFSGTATVHAVAVAFGAT